MTEIGLRTCMVVVASSGVVVVGMVISRVVVIGVVVVVEVVVISGDISIILPMIPKLTSQTKTAARIQIKIINKIFFPMCFISNVIDLKVSDSVVLSLEI